MATAPTPDLDWRDGAVPVARAFDDPYFSLQDGLAETQHVFLAGNDLPARLKLGFHVAELGFGTGLNLLALAQMAKAVDATALCYTGFEAFPLRAASLARALDAFPVLRREAQELQAAWPVHWQMGRHEFRVGPVLAEILVGDARHTVPAWGGQADAWFLDGFAPAKNPELWEPDLMREVARHTAANGTFATYTAAGAVRRALSDAGFTVSRQPGFGRKRHMTIGHLAQDLSQ